MDLSELYRDIVEGSPDGLWVIDLDGRTVHANPQIARLHRIDAADLPGLTVCDTLDHDGRARFLAHLEGVREGRLHEQPFEVQWVRSDGTHQWVICSETALLDDEGRPRALMRRYSDNTERHELISSLRASEDALEDQVAQNNLMQAVASAANEATSLGEVLAHARSLVLLHDDWERARAFVPSPDGSGTVEHFYPYDADRHDDVDDPRAASELALAQLAHDARGPVWDEDKLTLAFPVLLGTEVHAVVAIASAPPLHRHELIENMAGRVAEQLARVAEREQAQADVARARDEAMEASRQKSDFLAHMSHEIRTPLNGVIGLNDLLLRTPLTPEQERLASGVQTAGRTLLGLINEILDFSKIEAGRMVLEQLDFDVRRLLEQVASMLGAQAREKHLELAVSCHADVPAVLSGDPTRLAQVVTNLVSNAVKFTEHGGVTVRATAEPADGRVRLHIDVIDTGMGVPRSKRATLFEPFTQADSSTTRLYGGTGLGLAISSELMTAMGGTLEYAPNPDGGSVFTCTLVLDVGERAVAEPADAALPQRDEQQGKGVVLVVEDNQVNQLVATGLLAALGYATDTADDGLAAVEAARTGRYDAILMDVQMPRMDGYSATRHIRAHETGRRRPIIAMTAAAVEGERERCLEAGMDDFLTKPVDAHRLGETLQKWLAPEPSHSGRLDLDRLTELRTLDEPGDGSSYVDRAITNFLAAVDGQVVAMRSAADADDSAGLQAVAHRFAGSALNLGATALGEGARTIEEHLMAGAWDDAVAALDELVEGMAPEVEALRAYQREHFPSRTS
ncbi:hybrid sensor histidine kinase/response regulator [Nocardioides halotolerans]|uniref:hybrid sensor histidine kinase/response regulator n=1 Tax=Nocardioides halotolerans TaxID=433660 RepID=UPI00041937ED|nr:response regulator [Nocardioides halotolerans]